MIIICTQISVERLHFMLWNVVWDLFTLFEAILITIQIYGRFHNHEEKIWDLTASILIMAFTDSYPYGCGGQVTDTCHVCLSTYQYGGVPRLDYSHE